MTRKTNAEGGLVGFGLKEELADLRKEQKDLLRELAEAKERVKKVKCQLELNASKLGFTIDNMDQPDLPFPANGEYTP